MPTYYIGVSLSTRHPLASLEPPVIWISKYNIHKYIVVGSRVQAWNVEA